MSFPDISKLAETISKIRLRGGVVGTVGTILIVAVLSMAVISWSPRSVWIVGVSLMLVFILALVAILAIVWFADKKPYNALFEGAELLLHEQMKMGMKELPELPVVEQRPMLPSSEIDEKGIAHEAKKPDKPPELEGRKALKPQSKKRNDE